MTPRPPIQPPPHHYVQLIVPSPTTAPSNTSAGVPINNFFQPPVLHVDAGANAHVRFNVQQSQIPQAAAPRYVAYPAQTRDHSPLPPHNQPDLIELEMESLESLAALFQSHHDQLLTAVVQAGGMTAEQQCELITASTQAEWLRQERLTFQATIGNVSSPAWDMAQRIQELTRFGRAPLQSGKILAALSNCPDRHHLDAALCVQELVNLPLTLDWIAQIDKPKANELGLYALLHFVDRKEVVPPVIADALFAAVEGLKHWPKDVKDVGNILNELRLQPDPRFYNAVNALVDRLLCPTQ